MNADGQAKRPGRKATLPPEQRKRETFTFRVRSDLRDKMEKAAATNGRSLSEEIEQRLELSFTFEAVATPEFVSQMAKTIENINMKDRYISKLQELIVFAVNTHSSSMNAIKSVKSAFDHFASKHLEASVDPSSRREAEEIMQLVEDCVEDLSKVDYGNIADTFK